jgi:1,4-dihydroxy-2-naphthoate octaprenyltransferase
MSEVPNEQNGNGGGHSHWFVLVLLTVAFGVLRFTMPSQPLSWPGTYQAFAHIFLGFLLGAFVVSRKWHYLFFVLALSAVELTAFIMLHKQ